MNHFRLKNRVGWGNEIHIKTGVRTYAGSGRGFDHCDYRIRYVKPDPSEFFENGWPKEVDLDGHCSRPYVQVGDIVEYEFEKPCLPIDERLITNGFKLRVTKIEYCLDPHDMFFGKALIIEMLGDSVKQKTLRNRFKRWFKKIIHAPHS